MKRIRILLAMLCGIHIAAAQGDSTEKQKVQFKLSVNYNTGLNYFGRVDSLKSTGFFPLAEIWFTKDLYINAAPVFVNNAVQSFDYAGTVATLGYLHTSDKLITNLYLTKPFYEQSSQLVQSALKAQTGASFSFLNQVVNITAGGDLKFSDNIDLGATGGADHMIRRELANNSVVVIDPSFNVYAGTQNFTNSYYKKQKGFLLFPGNTQEVNENVKKFNVLAYEFSLPMIYARGKWMALLTPSYVLPQNLITVPNRPDLSERGKNLFYANIALKRSF